MTVKKVSYEIIQERFVQWAWSQEDIRTVLVIGSRGRTDHPADEWADLDLVFVTTAPYRYLTRTDWMEQLGPLCLSFVEKHEIEGILERRALFEGGLDVDFIPIALETMQKFSAVDMAPMEDVILPGIKVALDKDNFAEILFDARAALAEAPSRAVPPGKNAFLENISNFWYHAHWATKKLGRGELWTTIWCLDTHMKLLLLRMLEWHSRSTHGWDYNTWKNGRYLEEWADPRVVADLRSAFARYTREDIQQALDATLTIYRRVARETAHNLNYSYPTSIDEQITSLIHAA